MFFYHLSFILHVSPSSSPLFACLLHAFIFLFFPLPLEILHQDPYTFNTYNLPCTVDLHFYDPRLTNVNTTSHYNEFSDSISRVCAILLKGPLIQLAYPMTISSIINIRIYPFIR